MNSAVNSIMATDVINDITGVRGIIKARSSLGSDYVEPSIIQSVVDAIIQHINAMPVFGTPEAESITAALHASPYGDLTTRVVAAIDARVQASNSASAPPQDSGARHHKAKCWWNYLVPADWGALRDPNRSWHAKTTAAVDRANLLV